MSSSTKVIILGGFLGSGKTTLLLELGKYITAHSQKETPLAILENEIGEVDVDGAAVGQGGYAVKSLFAGCACCELLGRCPMQFAAFWMISILKCLLLRQRELPCLPLWLKLFRRYVLR